MIAITIKAILKIKCECQPIACKTPPQLQGTTSLEFKIAIIYAVKRDISANDVYKPAKMVLSINNMTEAIISIAGTIQTNICAKFVMIGDLLIWS